MLLCLYSQCLIGIGLHFVQRLVVFISLRFIQGIMIQGLQCVSYSMIMELFCPQYRTLAGCVAEAFWAGGQINFSLLFLVSSLKSSIHIISILSMIDCCKSPNDVD